MRELAGWRLAAAGLAALVSTAAVADDMRFALVKSGASRWIAAEGEITEATPDTFRRFLEDNGLTNPRDGLAVYLDSPGGNLMSGIKLGGLIRKQGLHTSIGKSLPAHGRDMVIRPGQCASACSFAFLGGTVRFARGGELGVHQSYDADVLDDPEHNFSGAEMSTQQVIGAIIVNFVVRMGADPRIASIAASTMPEDMHFFSEEELDDLRINFDPRRFEPWDVALDGKGVVARSRSEDGVRQVSLYCREDDGIVRLRLGGLGDAAEPMLAAIRDAGGLRVFGSTVEPKDAETADRDGDRGVELVIAGFHPDQVVGKKALRIGDDAGDAGRPADYPDITVPAENAPEAFAVALRNCI